MTDEELRAKLFAIVAAHARCDPATLTPDTTFDSLRMESLDIVQMLFSIEDTFDVYVPTEQQRLKSSTLGDLYDGVKALMAERNA